jgi:hypothetical protein
VTGYLVYAATYERATGMTLKGGILLSGSPLQPFGKWPDEVLSPGFVVVCAPL